MDKLNFAVVITANCGMNDIQDDRVYAVIECEKPHGREQEILDKWIKKYDPDYFGDTKENVRGGFRYGVRIIKLIQEGWLYE